MSEKIGGAKGTELDNDFHEMERVSTKRYFNLLLSLIIEYVAVNANCLLPVNK